MQCKYCAHRRGGLLRWTELASCGINRKSDPTGYRGSLMFCSNVKEFRYPCQPRLAFWVRAARRLGITVNVK